MEVQLYLEAIGLPQSIREEQPSVELLQRIYLAQSTRLPFSNLNVYTGADWSFKRDKLAEKFCSAKQGGLCTEIGPLTSHCLQELGFNAYTGAGEVWFMGQWSFPLSHGFTLIELDGAKYFLDIGFPMKPFGIIKLEHGTVQEMADGAKYVAKQVQEEGQPLRWYVYLVGPGDETDLSPVHRFEDRPVADSELVTPVKWYYGADSPFTNGWMLQIRRTTGENVTIANGVWAGHEVPLDQAKYVVRQPPSAGGGEAVTFLPLEGDEVARLVREEFGVAARPPFQRNLRDDLEIEVHA